MTTKFDEYHSAKRRLAAFDSWRVLIEKDKEHRYALTVSLEVITKDRVASYPRDVNNPADAGLNQLIRADVLKSLSTYQNEFRARLVENIRAARLAALNELADLIKEELST